MRSLSHGFKRAWGSELGTRFRTSFLAVAAALVLLVCVLSSVFANVVAPHNPLDLASLQLADARLPPAWLDAGQARYPLGTDDQGRDILSAGLFGARVSLLVGFASVLLSVALGVPLGLLAGYRGGWLDALLMRACDAVSALPAILMALLIAGIGHAVLPQADERMALVVLVLAIAFGGSGGWVQYARTVRGSTMVERNKDYVLAARIMGVSSVRIMRSHVLPNVLGPVLVLASIQVATAILTEATLSFLGLGAPATAPSLGTLIRIGNDYLFSGEWWIVLFPGLMLVTLSLSVNLLGDWLRDALNPRLR